MIRFFKKHRSIFYITVLTVIVFANYVYLIHTINEEERNYKEHLGKNYVINGDTLNIVDYSAWGETYTLSDGRKINKNLIWND